MKDYLSASLCLGETQVKTYWDTLHTDLGLNKYSKKKKDKQVLERNRETGTFRQGWWKYNTLKVKLEFYKVWTCNLPHSPVIPPRL